MSELQGKRILTYLRVSTEEQARNGESIADQRQALRKWGGAEWLRHRPRICRRRVFRPEALPEPSGAVCSAERGGVG